MPYLSVVNDAFEKWAIYTDLEKVHALAQVTFMCQDFLGMTETLRYTKEKMFSLHPDKFGDYRLGRWIPNTNLIDPYYGDPEAIANYVYASVNGNGDMISGDGWKYRGRGVPTLRGRNAYQQMGERIGKDLLTNPCLVSSDPAIFWDAFGEHWKAKQIGKYARKDDLSTVTQLMLGPQLSSGILNGVEERHRRLTKLKKAFGLPYEIIPKLPAGVG